MPITRSLALKIIKYLIDNPSFCFPFLVMCKGYGIDTDDNDFVEIANKQMDLKIKQQDLNLKAEEFEHKKQIDNKKIENEKEKIKIY
jgi:hypothetical protein